VPSARTHAERVIVLDHTKLAEQDLILTMLARDGKRLRAVAKGGRKPGGRLAGRCDLFCEDDVLLARGRGSLEIVSEAALVDAHAALRDDLDRMSCASAICEVARHSCFEDAADPYVHPITSRALAACEEAADRAHLDLVSAAYAFKLLAHEGWRPELEGCVGCGDLAATRFSASAGGVLCESCASSVEGAEPISPSQLGWLRALLALTFSELLAADVDPETGAFLASLAHVWATTQLDVRLRAFEFALSV
jgi:DNA repair protein RecO (recombination protein O)